VAIAIATSIPECGVTGFSESPADCWSRDTLGDAAADADALLIGPGLDDVKLTVALLDGALRDLGTSGSGDVLAGAGAGAGAIAGLLARGAEPAQAAVWATHLHAAAGDRLASRVGPLGFLARELVGELPAILAELNT
jgi:ADP-dependent NAD(P)H-hydrate dehydratase